MQTHFFSEINGNPRINNKIKTGFEKFLECLDLYLDLLNNPIIDEAWVKIYEWAQRFVQVFRFISSSDLKLSKLHSWIYHIIDFIRMYGAINGYTTETYETRILLKYPIGVVIKKRQLQIVSI